MDIGKQKRRITVEPAKDPVPRREPARPKPAKDPTTKPARRKKVPAGDYGYIALSNGQDYWRCLPTFCEHR